MNYEDAADKLIVYSQALAKGSTGAAYDGLSMGEAPVLDCLVDVEGGMNPSILAKRLGYTRSRVTRALNSLEAKGYVERRGDKADRRRVLVYATKAGREHTQRVRAKGVGDLADNLSMLGEHDAHELLRVLERAYHITYNREDIPDK